MTKLAGVDKFTSALAQACEGLTETDTEGLLSGLWRELWTQEELLADVIKMRQITQKENDPETKDSN